MRTNVALVNGFFSPIDRGDASMLPTSPFIGQTWQTAVEFFFRAGALTHLVLAQIGHRHPRREGGADAYRRLHNLSSDEPRVQQTRVNYIIRPKATVPLQQWSGIYLGLCVPRVVESIDGFCSVAGRLDERFFVNENRTDKSPSFLSSWHAAVPSIVVCQSRWVVEKKQGDFSGAWKPSDCLIERRLESVITVVNNSRQFCSEVCVVSNIIYTAGSSCSRS